MRNNVTEPPMGDTARCKPCRVGGVTNTDVVALATENTPGVDEGDFLCLFHNHPSAHPWKRKESK